MAEIFFHSLKVEWREMDPHFTGEGLRQVIPYKAGMRAAIATQLDEALTRRMLEQLVPPQTRVDAIGIKMVLAPYKIQDIRVESYRSVGLVIRLVGTLSHELYRQFTTLQATKKSA